MKKLLTVSIMAVMAVTAANAEIASKAYVDQQDDAVEAIVTALSGKVGNIPEGASATTVVGYIDEAVTSAGGQTEQQVSTAINTKVATLDGVVSGTGNVATAVTEADGIVTATMGNVLDKVGTATGDGNVITAISKNADGQTIDVVKGITALTATDIANKADKATTLTGYGITDAYTKTEVDTALGGKADEATTLAGYGITDAYTKTEVDTALGGKADEATTLAGYGITDAYTKTEADSAFVEAPETAVTAGTYPKVTVDAQGLVTAGASLAEADIPALSISKVTNLQTTLDGKQDNIGTATGSDGVYVLTGTISGNSVTYKWEQIQRGTGE